MNTNRTSGIVSYFAGNPVAANITMVLLLVGGLLAGLSLTAQIFPTIDPGMIQVSVPYPGATPTEVEEGITRRVEEAVFGIEGVDRVISQASENNGVITVELKDFVDEDTVKDDIEAAIDQISDFPPGDAEQPKVIKVETLNEVMTLVVTSDLSERYLREGAQNFEDALLDLPSVSLASMQARRDYEISISVSEASLRRFGLSIEQVANTIRQSSLNLASGELKTEAGDLLLRTNAKRETGEEFADIILKAKSDGTLLKLGDVATIHDGFVDENLINEFNGHPAVLISVKASVSEDILTIANDIKELISNYQPAPGIKVQIWSDNSEILRGRLNLLVRNGVLGFALVFLFLVVMLDLRLAIWVAMGVPISFLGAFLFFDYMDVNINMVSLFALIIVLGIVVDDAIVVGENIITEQELGLDGTDAAISGVTGVMSPVLIGVLTTMAAFAPLLFITGTFGQILGVVPVIVIAVLAMSLIEAFFILPAHLAHGSNWSRSPLTEIQAGISQRVEYFRDKIVMPLIKLAVHFRYRTLAVALAFLIGSFSLLSTGAVRFIFFPALESEAMSASIVFPMGTPFQTTKTATERIVDAAYRINSETGDKSLQSVTVTIGGQVSSGFGPSSGSSVSIAGNVASVQIQLNPEPQRTLSASELERRWRIATGNIAGIESLTFSSQFSVGAGTDLTYELTHQNEETLFLAVDALKQAYAAFPSVYDIQDSYNLGKRQYDVELTSAGESAGLTPAAVARQLRRNFFGEEVQRIQRGREELKVMVRYPHNERRSIQDLYNTRIHLPDGSQAPLQIVANLIESRSYSTINRADGKRIVTVSGKIDKKLGTPTEINNAIQQEVLPELLDQFPGLNYLESGFGKAQSEDLASLGNNSIIALLVIFAMLATQLRSYVQPFIIMSAIPFGAAGALIGHFVLGYDLSFVSVFGIIALSGVVVNDSLILIDRYNRFRRETDFSPVDAVIKSAEKRFRAIILTTATTALGLTPMLFETSIQAQFLIPMAVSLAVGIVFASVIILFLVPVLVIIREDIREITTIKVINAIRIIVARIPIGKPARYR
jgi:multidrug efflux pump subunit AcrB